MHTEEEATHFVEVFISTPFSNEERHIRRIELMSDYEKSGVLPALPGASADS
jgi:ribose 5-phosphate isomerase B